MMRVLGYIAVVVSLALLAGPAAHAQAAPPNAPGGQRYDQLIDSALAEYRLGHWVEAKAYFTQAHALQPNARTLRGLGLVCYELRKYVEAIDYFSQALTNANRPLTPTMIEGVNQLLHDAQRFVSQLDLQITPATASLTLDGRPVQRNAQGQLSIDAGSHELTAEAPGYESATRSLTTDGGETMRVSLTLRSTQPALAEAAAPSRAEPQPVAATSTSDSGSDSIAPWIVVGASGAVMITGGILLGVALSDKAGIEDTQKGTKSWSQVESAYDRVPVLSTVGAIMLGVGAAGVVAGLTWNFWPRETGEQASLTLRPLPGGAALHLTF